MSTAARAPRSLIRAAIVGGALAAVAARRAPARARLGVGRAAAAHRRHGGARRAVPVDDQADDVHRHRPHVAGADHQRARRHGSPVRRAAERRRSRSFNGSGVAPGDAVLDIKDLVSSGSEQGLLGLAFHPDFKTNRKFYVNFTNTAGNTVVREYKASASNPNRVARAPAGRSSRSTSRSRTTTAATLAFGPGGYLYIGMGDGGSGGRPGEPRAGHRHAAGQDAPDRRQRHVGHASTTASRRRTRTSAGRGATRSGCAASATRGAARSTRRPTASGSATSARAGTRRSTASRRPRRAPTWAGGGSRATPATTRRATATRRAR